MRIVGTPLAAPFVAPAPREGGVDRRLLEAIVAAPGTAPLLDRLGAPGTLVVTTGQQAGLFTGPLYTIHKALAAAALAAELSARWQRPVVPLFWLATDDHDYVEATAAAWLAPDGTVRHAALPARAPDAPLTPMYREPLGDAVLPLRDQLIADLAAGPDHDAVAGWLERHYRPDATVGGAYAGAMAELLAPHGILCLDASHRAVKQLAAPWILRAVQETPALEAALVPLAASLAAEGRDPGVALGDGATLALLECATGRDRLLFHHGELTTRRGHGTISLDRLGAIAAEDPQRLSPNVLLRPVIESALLPSVAYVAGPGELRYLALTPPVYARLGVAPQRPVARWSGLLVEPRVDRVLEKFGLTLEELLAPGHAAEAKVARDQLPAELVEAIARLRGAVEREYEPIRERAVAVDPTLDKPVQAARNGALSGLADVERKVLQHLKKRRETELQQLARARSAVQPDGKPQERLLTVAPFLARYGSGLLSDILGAARAHYAAALEPAGTAR